MKNTVRERNIKVIWHFTRLSNLDSILKHGLRSRRKLEQLGIITEINDPYRFDNQENATCCSLGHPNYKMFYTLRQDNPEVEWVVLGIKKSILWKKDCAFCVENAASGNVTCIPIHLRKGKEAFNKMFEEIEDKPSRKELGISECCPTNPQAELLVFASIPPKYILVVVSDKKKIADHLAQHYKELDILHNNALFFARKDYQHW